MNKHILIVILSILFCQLSTNAQISDPLADGSNSPIICTHGCIDNLTVAYVPNDNIQIWPQDLLESNCEGAFKLTVVDEDENVIFEQQEDEIWTINSDDVNKTYVYAVEHVETENLCWGHIIITDKINENSDVGSGDTPEVECLEIPLDFTSFILDEELEFSGKTIEEIDTEVFINYFLAWDNMLLANNVDPNSNRHIAGFNFSDYVEELDNGDLVVTRTFQLIDWCHFVPHDGNSDIYTFVQKIIIRNLGSMFVSDINFAESTASISINKMTVETENGLSALVQLESNETISSSIAKTIETQGWENNSYKLEVEKYESCVDGISSIDLVQVLRHILNLESLDSNVKTVAADIDENDQITAADLVKMRRIILGIDNCNNDSNWRFYNSNLNSDETFSLHKLSNYNLSYSNDSDNTDFSIVALKKGDVNLSAIDESESRSLENILTVDNKNLIAGKTYNIPIRLTKNTDIISATVSFEKAPFEILGFSSNVLNLLDSNYNISTNKSSLVFYEQDAISLNEGDNILNIQLKAKENGMLEELLEATTIDFKMYDSANARESTSLGIEYINPLSEINQSSYTPIINHGTLTFIANSPTTETEIQALNIFTMDGKQIYSSTDINVNNIKIDLATLDSQLLIYSLITDLGYSQTDKFFVQ